MGNVETSGPNEALVISGGCFKPSSVNIIVGGWGWSWWCLTDVQRLSLSVMTLIPRCEDVETLEGVSVSVTGVAQVKVMNDHRYLTAACEHFLGRGVSEIKDTLLHTMEGHLRAILGTLSVEAIYGDRDTFARLVREVAAPDVLQMGVELLSFTIKDVFDRVQYLDSLGRGRIAQARRDAEIGVAEAERDAGIREADFEKELVNARCKVDGAISDSQFRFTRLQTQYEEEVNAAMAEAELAFDLQTAKEQQVIRAEEVEVEIIQRRREVEIEQEEITRNQRVLEYSVHLPAKAEATRTAMLAEAQRSQKVLEAKASAGAIRVVGAANAIAVEAIGAAEADALVETARAFERFTDTAKLSSILTALPNVAAQIVQPLTNTREIILLSGPLESRVNVKAFVETAKRLFGDALPPEIIVQMASQEISQT